MNNIIITNNINPPISTKNNYSIIKGIIETPYDRVLSILQEALNSLTFSSKAQTKLFTDFQWIIKIIKNKLLYSFEIKEKEYALELSKKDPDFKSFIDYIKDYNEQMNDLKKKNNYINNKLLQKPLFKLKKHNEHNIKLYLGNKRMNSYDINKLNKEKIIINCSAKEKDKTSNNNNVNVNAFMNNNFNFYEAPIIINNMGKMNIGNIFNDYRKFGPNKNKKNVIRRNNQINSLNLLGRINSSVSNDRSNNLDDSNEINHYLSLNPNIKHKRPKINLKNLPNKKINHNLDSESQNKIIPSNHHIDNIIRTHNYDTRQILSKDFNIFDLIKLIGKNNVLPLVGTVVLDTFGLKNDKYIKVSKLELFLKTINEQYLPTTIYHNNIHGSDVCLSSSLYFLNSNAQKIFEMTSLDILSIIIGSLGHDLGHPGLTNNFHINAQTDLALTYNDNSCLENYHCSKLFNILKKDETNIFEVLNKTEFKGLRKRIVSEIIATDMFYHKTVVDKAENKIGRIKDGKYIFINNDEKSVKEEQQNILDFCIHVADVAHNSKPFDVSLIWVELLSEEYWLQGDKEKSLGIEVSFLCDRNDINIPKSQIGFFKFVIIPSFNILNSLLPGLEFTTDNINKNFEEWKKLLDENRKRGWTPK